MKIDVIKLLGKWINRESTYAIEAMVQTARDRGHDVHFPPDVFGSAMITRARNQSLQAIRQDADYVLFVDDDMVPVQGALTRLIGHNKPVVSALCTTRTIPPELACRHYDKTTDRFSKVSDFDENILVRGPWILGFGFVLIQKPVLDAVIEYVLSGRDWLELNRKVYDRMHVRAENRDRERQRIESARRRLYEAERIAPVFQMPIHDELQHEIGEDSHFSRLLHLMGVDVWLDTGCLVGHIGDFPYSPIHLGAKTNFDISILPQEASYEL